MSRKPLPIPAYTQAGLARKAGVTRYAVFKAIERGLLETVTTLDGEIALVGQEEAERWLRDRRTKPGRPPKAPK